VEPADIKIVSGPLVRVKLKSGGAGEGGVEFVFALVELDVVVEDVEAALEDGVVLDKVVDEVLGVVVVLVEEAFCVDLG
jgi:hypothetical protein